MNIRYKHKINKSKKDHQSEREGEKTSPQNTPLQPIAWGARSEDATSESIKGHILGLLLHLNATAGANAVDLGFTDASSTPQAFREFKAQELKLFPYGHQISDTPPEKDLYIILNAKVVGEQKPQDFYISAPGLPTEGAPAKAGQTLTVWPFWNAVAAAGDGHALQYTKHTFEVGSKLNAKPQGKEGEQNKGDVKQRMQPTKIFITVPYLVNPVNIAKGDLVTSGKSTVVVDKRSSPP